MTAPNNVTPPTPPAQVPVDGGQPRRHDNKQGKKPLYKRWWFWLIVVLVVLGVVGSTQSGDDTATSASTESSTSQTATPDKSEKPTEPTKPAEPAKPAEKTIELQATATGNGTAMIWENGSSSSQQFSGSWSKTYTGDEAKDLTMLSVTGDIMGDNNQQVSCKVIVDGQEKVSKDASGSAGTATCNVPLF